MSKHEALLKTLRVQPGAVIAGKYRIERLIAAGSMGAVLQAHHETLDQIVAIKVMRPEVAHRRDAAKRFLREARAAARIRSDFVAHVTDVDVHEGMPYMVMEHLEGQDLHQLMVAEGRLPIAQSIDYVLQVTAGLEAAHALGIVHRDLKPSNLYLVRQTNGTTRMKILDFGISKVIEDDVALKAGATTSQGLMLGTPRYMSPEHVRSAKSVDARSDLWAVGVILYELLTGTHPFQGQNAGAILANILSATIWPVRGFNADVPYELERVVTRCLERDPNQRFTNARELMQALGPFATKRMQLLLLEPDEHVAPGAPRSADALRGASPLIHDADPQAASRRVQGLALPLRSEPPPTRIEPAAQRPARARVSAPEREGPSTQVASASEVPSRTRTDSDYAAGLRRTTRRATWKLALGAVLVVGIPLGAIALARQSTWLPTQALSKEIGTTPPMAGAHVPMPSAATAIAEQAPPSIAAQEGAMLSGPTAAPSASVAPSAPSSTAGAVAVRPPTWKPKPAVAPPPKPATGGFGPRE